MIVSASYKTDIPAFFGPWFAARLAAGWVAVKNPYGGQVRRVGLAAGEAEAFVFWTRNVGPFLATLADLAAEKRPFVVQFTATGYPRPLEAATITADAAVAQVRALAATYGRRAVVWRYDPVIATSLTPPAWHRVNFARLCAALAGSVDEVVLSFAQIYAKTRRNLTRAAAEHQFTWDDPAPDEKSALLIALAGIARDHGLRPSLCGQRELLADGLDDARCIDTARLSDVAGYAIDAAPKPHRRCGCAQSVDIGGYDTCPHGCVYCYAVSARDVAKRNVARHDPGDARL